MRPNVSRSDDVNSAAALISATPIISAEAVPGRAPRRPHRRSRGPGLARRAEHLCDRPADDFVTGRATVDDRLATPRKIISAPPPAVKISPNAPPGCHEQPDHERATPTTVTITPTTSRGLELIAAKPSSGRIAATGGTLAARRAGRSRAPT